MTRISATGQDTGFTPGPWFLSAQGGSVVARPTITLPNGEERWTTTRIASFSSSGGNEANARLIAAAPDMFEALENIRSAASGLNHPALCIIDSIAAAALAKVRP